MKTRKLAMFTLGLTVMLMAVTTGFISGSTRAQPHLDVTPIPGETQAFPVFPGTADIVTEPTASSETHTEVTDAPESSHIINDAAPTGLSGAFSVHLPLVIRDFRTIFFDDFSNPNSGWIVDNSGNIIWRYTGGEYQIYFEERDWIAISTPSLSLPGDYRIEVDARKVSPGGGAYGLIFGVRRTSDSWESYEVFVSPSESAFLIIKRTIDRTIVRLRNWTFSSAIKRDNETNRIRVDRIGATIRVYINGTMVANVTDSSFTGSGRDAGVAGISGDAPTDVRFDNFRVFQP